ncbi:MAG TPA: amino acid ABC transporter ATP-binding protein [Alphaproteobacteria bacterium]|nr:amino acid ABC transporter ATP-binding protein [Alphaproteobacteria bacterium]
MVEARNVFKRFGDVTVLEDVSLSVPKGSVTAIIGPSGSGKTTFIRCVNHMHPIDSGVILVDGDLIGYRRNADGSLSELREREFCRQRASIGMVFQHFNLFAHLSVIDNLTEAPVRVLGIDPKDARRRAMANLELVGMAEKASAMPGQISGGQQQRVAIARALTMEPKLLLFDEPTSMLDPELVGEVLRVMENLASSGLSMIIVTHEMAFARQVCDTVVFMDQGKVIEFGPPDQVFTNPKSPRTKTFLDAVMN